MYDLETFVIRGTISKNLKILEIYIYSYICYPIVVLCTLVQRHGHLETERYLKEKHRYGEKGVERNGLVQKPDIVKEISKRRLNRTG